MVYPTHMNKKTMEEFVSRYTAKMDIIEKMESNKKKVTTPVEKIKDDAIIVPDITNYELLFSYNYNLNQLKLFAKYYKLKITGTKPKLISRIFTHLYLSRVVIVLQKYVRGKLQRKYNMLHGVGFIKRTLCVNAEDFVTLQCIKSIDFHQFISFTDNDGFVYGCDIASLYTLITNAGNKPFINPYNRSIIPKIVYTHLIQIIRLSKIFKRTIELACEDDFVEVSLSIKKQLDLRCLSLFQSIDSLGNYSNHNWFMSLSKIQLFKFMRELIDLWNYRAELSVEVKRQICPPHGDPFVNLNIPFIYSLNDLDKIKLQLLIPLEKMVCSGINEGSSSLGAIYILSALTLVNKDAAEALPWLYQSVNYQPSIFV